MRFEKETDLTRNLDSLIKDLVELRLLKEIDQGYQFREKYIFYYFVAFYLKDRLNEPACREIVSECSRKAWVQDYANVLLFLAHLSKDTFIVETILTVAKETFSEIEVPRMEGEISILLEALTSPLELDEDLEQSKETRRAPQDEVAPETQLSHTPHSFRRDADFEEVGLIGQFSAALKTLQVLGQILKNFPANFEPHRKVEIVNECVDLGLRTLGNYFKYTEEGKESIIGEFADLIHAQLPEITKEEAKKRATHTILNLCHLSTFGVIKRISYAIGSSELTKTYDKVFTEQQSPARSLVKVSMDLDKERHFPEQSILLLAKSWKKNHFALRVLRSLVIRHFRLFHRTLSIRQRLGEKLGISYRKTTALPEKDKLI